MQLIGVRSYYVNYVNIFYIHTNMQTGLKGNLQVNMGPSLILMVNGDHVTDGNNLCNTG